MLTLHEIWFIWIQQHTKFKYKEQDSSFISELINQLYYKFQF